jgi:predicted membrane-bound mannosyltransferase
MELHRARSMPARFAGWGFWLSLLRSHAKGRYSYRPCIH